MTILHKLLYASASILLLTLAVCAFLAVLEWRATNRQLRSALNEVQWLVSEARPETRTILKEGKFAVNELRRSALAFTEDFNSRENQRGRMATMRAGESVAALAARFQSEVLPALTQTLKSTQDSVMASKALLVRVDHRLSDADGLLPEATALLTSLRGTSDAFGVDSRAVLAEVVTLTRSGQTSIEAVNKVLTSPEWLATLKNIERGTGNVADATAQLPATAESVERILKTSAKWQKPLLLASLLATIGRAFIP